MADVNANIDVNIDTSLALAQLKSLQRQISQFHTSISRSSETAALAQKSLQKNFLNSVNAIGSFSAELRTVKTTTESFTSSLEGNKFSMREYFRYAGGATKTFGRLFKSEFDTIGKVAEERVKRLQTQYIKMGRDASGSMQAMSITPTSLNMQDYGTKTAIAAQKQALFNQLMKQGSTNLLNFGKNTQWAGRQLMVGFTIPLAMVGSAATKTFMDMEAQAIKFKKVYGDLFTPREETQQALDNIVELGKQFTRYGVAVSATVGLAAEAAAAGFSGLDLQRQTTEATRLSILGQIDNQKALETTISLQNAFGMSSDKLADSINFLNAVENQTVVSLDDITTAIPKVAPVIQQLGGDVKDLTFFLAAMKEGGINASEGANALKSGLAALINPTGRASAMLESFGINAKKIVTDNKGNLKATVVEFATALNQLDPLNRAQAIEQMFGKFQFARLSTLFANVAKDGNQAARVLDLANSSVEELSALSEQELGMTADSAMNKFKKTVEDLKIALVPVGKAFLEAVTPIVEFVGNILEKFGNLSEGTKKAITLMVTVVGGLGPILLMTFGLLANGVANIIKLFLTLRNGYLRLTGQSQVLGESTQYLTMEQIEAASASHSLNQAHATLTQQFTAEASAVNQLILAYQNATKAAAAFAITNPGAMRPPMKKFSTGGIVRGSGGETGDKIPIMASDGEAVIPARTVNANKKIIGDLLSTGTFKPKVDLSGPSGSAARSGFSYSNTNRLIAGQGLPGATIGVPGNMPSQSQSRDLFKKVKVPGAMNLSHFGEKQTRTGEELRAMVEGLETTLANNIRKMVASVENGATETFRVFDNQVVAQLDEINNAMDKKGKAPIKFAKENLIGDAFAPVRDIELQTQLEAAKVPLEDIKNINKKLTDEMVIGFDKLGDVTEITSDQLDKLIREAYEAVAKTDERVAKAYNKMKEITTVFQPGKKIDGKSVRGKRVPITTESYDAKRARQTGGKNVYRAAQERMVGGAENVPYPALADFGINEKKIQGLGLNIKEAQAKFKELSDTTKVELSKLAGNTDAFAAAFKAAINEVETSGVALGQAAVKSIGKGAKTASPSKDTIRTGEDVGKGLELGMESRKDDVARVGESLGKTATQSTSRGVRTVGNVTPGVPPTLQRTGGGVTVGQVAANAPISPNLKEKVAEQARVTQMATDKMRSLDRNIMGASFAISSLSGIASMSGGKLGAMSGTISKVTGALFALQAVTGLLTQTNMIALVQKRLEIAKSAGANALAAGPVFGGLSKAISGRAGLTGIIARVGLRLVAFLGPIGMAIAAVGTVYGAFKFFKNRSDQAAFAAEGLGKAMTLTKDKVNILAGLLGQTATPRAGSGARVSANQLDAKGQVAVDELRSSKEFLDKYKNDIRAIKEATVGEATIAFNAIALDLSGQGFTKDAIKTYIDALGEEAGKTEVSLKFKQIDLSKEEGVAAAVKLAKDVTKGFNKALEGKLAPILPTDNLSAGATVTSKLELSKDLQKELNISSAQLANTLTGLTSAFGNQTIKADGYNAALAEIATVIPQGTAGLLLMNKIMTNINPKFAEASAGIKDYDTKMLLLKASLVNASVAQSIFTKLMSNDQKVVAAARAELEKYRIVTDAIAKNVVIPDAFKNVDTGTKEKSPFELAIDQLKQQKKEMLNTVKAYSSLRAAGVAAGKAFEVAKDPILAAAIATTKVGTDKWKQLIKLIKETDAALIKSKITELTANTDYTKAFTAVVPVLKSLGLNAEEINDIFADPTFAQQFINNIKNGKVQVADLEKLIKKTMQNRTAKLTLETSLKSEDELFDEAMDKANEMFDKVQAGIEAQYRGQIKSGEVAVEKAQQAVEGIQKEIDVIQTTIDKKQRDIEINITRQIEKFQTQIDTLQNTIKEKFDTPLQKLSDEGDILSNNLSLIDRQTSKINEKYDAQAAALTKISEINADIAGQQKQQLGLADALSRGDIAAAAIAAQEMRESAAGNARNIQSGILESARTAELAGVTVNGMTRLQIEERQFQISQQNFVLQQQRKILEQSIADIEAKQIAPLNVARLAAETAIRVEEDRIYVIQQGSLKEKQAALTAAEEALKKTEGQLKADLAIITQNKQAWLDAKTLRDLDFLEQQESAKKYKGILTESETIAKGIIAKLAERVTTIHNIHTTYTSSGSAPAFTPTSPSTYVGGTKVGGSTQTKMYGGKVMPMNYGGMVPKYMAMGGMVGSDSIPAMLTPGEFVMNRAATEKFGPLLSMINESKYPSMIGKSYDGQGTFNNNTSLSDNSNTMYNYNVGINVNESNASSSDIARAVIGQIKYIDSQRIRGQK